MTDSEIESIIAMSDAGIDKELGPQDPSDVLVKKLSVLVSALTIKGRQPQSSAAGEYREDAGNIHEVWGREIKRITRLYRPFQIASSEYTHIDEDERYGEES